YTVYANQSEADVYMLTKALIDGYDGYKDNAPGASGLAVKGQAKYWAVPLHPGAVKALKEAGTWSDDQDKHNKALFKRQDVLQAAWGEFNKANPSSDPAKFTEEGMKARKAALGKAGMADSFEWPRRATQVLRRRGAGIGRGALPQQLCAGKTERDHDRGRRQQRRNLAGRMDAEAIGNRADG